MTNKESTLHYDPDADVLAWEMNDRPIAYAREVRGIVVHFSENHVPVLVEVLEVTHFLGKIKDVSRGIQELGAAAPYGGPIPQ